MAAKTTKVTVKLLSFPYTVEVEDRLAPDGVRYVRKRAGRGEEIEVFDEDLDRGKRLNAFRTDEDDQAEEEAAEGTPNVVDASDDELVVWIQEETPTVQEVLDASEGDPESAKRLLDAEESATGGAPRATLVEGLSRIIGSAE